MKNLKRYQSHYDKVNPISELLGIKLAPLRVILDMSPDEFLGMEFAKILDEGAIEAKNKYTQTTQTQLIVAFSSHDWSIVSDRYGHDGLRYGLECKKCGCVRNIPYGDWTDDFILAYHYVYGKHKRFGGRITKCKGK